jgi:hypothetical protein
LRSDGNGRTTCHVCSVTCVTHIPNNFGKTLAYRRKISDAFANPSGIKRERYVCMYCINGLKSKSEKNVQNKYMSKRNTVALVLKVEISKGKILNKRNLISKEIRNFNKRKICRYPFSTFHSKAAFH